MGHYVTSAYKHPTGDNQQCRRGIERGIERRQRMSSRALELGEVHRSGALAALVESVAAK